ncbi:hypothetical protein [Halalkalibacter krulwichiae]|uniref:Uncharacterized protein n=1 Tax=Halalkalibacter krulwichiae TaxID=199441 RepID=A0A1X9MH44_9BACI|nr:hypothetical protein [Halalkalibacter krulwichiae]ARK31954.1 hypothetical protein BkAM31D_20080 [Halalkalibacter krulwichiae]
MIRAIFLGVFFVFLCVSVPGIIGLYLGNQTENLDTPNQNELVLNAPNNQVIDSNEEELTPSFPIPNNEHSSTQIHTKDDAIELILEEFTFTELLGLYRSIQNGVSEEEKEELLALLEERFSQEEIEALKVFGFSELEKVLQ